MVATGSMKSNEIFLHHFFFFIWSLFSSTFFLLFFLLLPFLPYASSSSGIFQTFHLLSFYSALSFFSTFFSFLPICNLFFFLLHFIICFYLFWILDASIFFPFFPSFFFKDTSRILNCMHHHFYLNMKPQTANQNSLNIVHWMIMLSACYTHNKHA